MRIQTDEQPGLPNYKVQQNKAYEKITPDIHDKKYGTITPKKI